MQTMTISEFMNRPNESLSLKVKRHFKKHHVTYKIVGSLLIVTVSGGMDFATPTSAASGADAFQTGVNKGVSGIDIAGRGIYYSLVGIGKWIIVFKGGMETIKSAGNGDFDGAKKHFFSYLLVYLLLLGLPFGFDKVDEVFREIQENS